MAVDPPRPVLRALAQAVLRAAQLRERVRDIILRGCGEPDLAAGDGRSGLEPDGGAPQVCTASAATGS